MDGMTPLRRNPGSGQHPSGHHSSGAADNSGTNPPEPQDAPEAANVATADVAYAPSPSS